MIVNERYFSSFPRCAIGYIPGLSLGDFTCKFMGSKLSCRHQSRTSSCYGIVDNNVMFQDAVETALPRLYPILDTQSVAARACDPTTVALAWLDSGARILQYRHKAAWTRAIFEQAEQIAADWRHHG